LFQDLSIQVDCTEKYRISAEGALEVWFEHFEAVGANGVLALTNQERQPVHLIEL